MSLTLPAPSLRELTGRQIQWIGAGYGMTLASMAGQTVFIAQFNGPLRETFALSHGAFGLLYTLATLMSSISLIWVGALADRIAPRPLAVACALLLAATCLLMSQVQHVVVLGLALFGLRLLGQGMMTHIAVTTMSRWFNRFRGRALAFTQLGFPSGEAILPFVITIAIGSLGWRQVWIASALALVLLIAPVLTFLLRDPPDGKKALARGAVNPDGALSGHPTGRSWTRGVVLRDRVFWLAIPGFMGPPAIGTLFIFHQAHLAQIKGWELTSFTALFPVLSVSTVVTSLVSGALIDRFGAFRLIPLVLLPEAIGCLALGATDAYWAMPVFFASFGMTMGLMSPVLGALWAELYGTAHLGAIRALATSAFVLASAVGPGLAGTLIDLGFELDRQAFFYAGYCVAAACLYAVLRPVFAARAAEIAGEREALMPG